MADLKNPQITGVIDDIIKEVSNAADILEQTLDDHVFDTAVHNLVSLSLFECPVHSCTHKLEHIHNNSKS